MSSVPDSPGTDLVPYSIGYVYQWVDSSNGMMYVGSHGGNKRKYTGSGTHFKAAYKARKECFRRFILYTGPYFREVEGHVLSAVGAANNPKYYNLVNNSYQINLSQDAHDRRVAAQNNPDTKKKRSEANTRAHAKPETKALYRDSIREAMSRPEVREKLAAHNRRPEVKKFQSENSFAIHGNPEIKARMLESLREWGNSLEGRTHLSYAASLGRHVSKHLNIGIWNLEVCPHCIEDVETGRRPVPAEARITKTSGGYTVWATSEPTTTDCQYCGKRIRCHGMRAADAPGTVGGILSQRVCQTCNARRKKKIREDSDSD
jgi:hypothetical protein